MDVHSVFKSPPAVAGLVLLALVVGTVFAVRATMNGGGDTDVAGTVIERIESPSEFVDPEPDDTAEPLIVRPRRDRRVAQEPAAQTEQDGASAPAPAAPVAPVDPVDEEVGLVRDEPAPVVEPTTNPRPDRDRNPGNNEPDPQPTRGPAPEPDPEPDPDPDPDPEPDTSAFELRRGTGLTRDSVDAYQLGNSGQYEWEFRNFAGHDNQDAATQRSRATQARLSVGFSDGAKNSTEQVRTFRCDALLTAGSRRLLTDMDHVFEISLWTTTDGYNPDQPVEGSVIVRQAFDMEPGESRRLLGNTYELDAAAEVDYICQAVYRSR